MARCASRPATTVDQCVREIVTNAPTPATATTATTAPAPYITAARTPGGSRRQRGEREPGEDVRVALPGDQRAAGDHRSTHAGNMCATMSRGMPTQSRPAPRPRAWAAGSGSPPAPAGCSRGTRPGRKAPPAGTGLGRSRSDARHTLVLLAARPVLPRDEAGGDAVCPRKHRSNFLPRFLSRPGGRFP